MDSVLSQLGKDSRRNLTICQLGIEADLVDAKAEEAARQVAALPQPLTTIAEAERAAIVAALEAARSEMLREGASTLPHEQQPITPEPAPEDPIAPAAEVPMLPASPPSHPSAAPLVNPFWTVEPLGCRGW
jgi:hypothetical protein